MTALVVIGTLAVLCTAVKALGPLVLADRPLPARARVVIERMPPALLVGLVLAGTVAGSDGFVLDERAAGVGAVVVATLARLPMVAVLAIAIAVTALLRAVS